MKEFGQSFMGLRAAYLWAEHNASGSFSCIIQCILGEGADVPVTLERVPVIAAENAGPLSRVTGYSFVRAQKLSR